MDDQVLTYLQGFGHEVVSLLGEVPIVGTVCKAFLSLKELAESVKTNQEDIDDLVQLLDYIIKEIIRERSEATALKDGFTRLKNFVKEAKKIALLCNQSWPRRVLMARNLSGAIASLQRNVRDYVIAINLILSVEIHKKLFDMDKQRLEWSSRGLKAPKVPPGAPRIRTWYTERTTPISQTCQCLGVGSSTGSAVGESPRMVGLAGPSGAGKSTVASMVVAREDVRRSFNLGVIWLSVGKGAKNRLPALMFDLACIVWETVLEKMGLPPRKATLRLNSEDGAAYIRELADEIRRHFLVVADDVWEVEVLKELKRAGVWVLYTTRMDDCLMPGADPLRLDEVRKEEAELVLRRAADLDEDTRLPDAAYELMERCSFVVLDLVLVGRWGLVRGLNDDKAWRQALGRIVKAQSRMDESQKEGECGQPLSWRAAVLRAGLKELAWDDSRNKELYLALAIVPVGLAFSREVAGLLLYGNDCSVKQVEATQKVLETLERWSIVTLEVDGEYRVHEDHVDFVWEHLLKSQETRDTVLPRWRAYVSSIPALRAYSSLWLTKIWDVFSRAEGAGVAVAGAVARPYDEALSAMDQSSAEFPEALEKAAEFHFEREDWRDAFDKYSQLRRIEESASKGNSLNLARILHQLGMCANNIPGQEEETEELLRKALAIQEEKLGLHNVSVANTLHSLGVCIREAGRPKEAEGLLRQALDIRKEKLGEDPLSLARILYSLAVCVYNDGRLEEAERDMLTPALEIRQERLGSGHPEVANALYHLGVCVHRSGRTAEGEEYLQKALGIFEQKLGSDHLDVADTRFALGVCALGAERVGEARELFQRSLEIRRQKLAEDHPKVSATLRALGDCSTAEGRAEEATWYYRQAGGLLEEGRNVTFGYEAAVSGGIPIINGPEDDFPGGRVCKVSAFLEESTRFMHSKAGRRGASYQNVLREALDEGYAEADLRSLLAELSFGATMASESIRCTGVSSLAPVDFEYAKEKLRSTIKLLGTAVLSADGATLSVFVSPVLVSRDRPVAATAAAAAGHRGSPVPVEAEDWEMEENLPSEFYMRVTGPDEIGIVHRLGELAKKNEVSIQEILCQNASTSDFVVTTHSCNHSQMGRLSSSIGQEHWAECMPLILVRL